MNLKELRISKGFSQQKAAILLETPLRTYKRYENTKEYENSLKYKTFFDKLSQYEKVVTKSRKKDYQNVTIVGAGYVGYHTGKVLSKKCKVSFVDIDKNKINKINEEAFAEAFENLEEVKRLDVVILCLPTNLDEKTKVFDTSIVEKTLEKIYSLNQYAAVVIKSTVPIGFTSKMIKRFHHNIAFIPEFLREKSALYDSLHPSRLIVGIDKSNVRIKEFAKTIEECIEVPKKTIFMSTKEAETVKLYSNAYLAMRVAFFNELDTFASTENLDTKKIIKSIGFDPRIGDFYNNPSFCFSGYCFPKDTKNLFTQTHGELLGGVISSNETRKHFIVETILKKVYEINEHPTIGFYKLESKNNRISSTTEIKAILEKYPVNVVVFDENYEKSITDFDEFCKVSDLIVCNTYDDKLETVKYKVFTRDLLSK